MRRLLVAAAMAVALVSGCLTSDGQGSPDPDEPLGTDPDVPADQAAAVPPAVNTEPGRDDAPKAPEAQGERPPAPLHWEGTFTLAADAGSFTGTPCGALSSCDQRTFRLEGAFDLKATLSWGLPANDFDLYLFEADDLIAQAGRGEPGDLPTTRESLVVEELPPGDYTFWVVGSTMVRDTYVLDAVFS